MGGGGECEPYGDDYLCTEPGLSSQIRDVVVLLLDTPIDSLTPVPLRLDAEGLELSHGIASGYGERTPAYCQRRTPRFALFAK